MIIQNTEMEFISFDAQDVITTSGPFYGQTLAAQIGAVYNYDIVDKKDNIYLTNSIGNTAGIIDQTTGGWTSKANSWLIYFGAESDSNDALSGHDYLVKADSSALPTKPADKSYFYVDNSNYALIGQWLIAQGIQ